MKLSLFILKAPDAYAVLLIDTAGYFLLAIQVWLIGQLVTLGKYDAQYLKFLLFTITANAILVVVRYFFMKRLIRKLYSKELWIRSNVVDLPLGPSFLSKGVQAIADTVSSMPSAAAIVPGTLLYLFILGIDSRFALALSLILAAPFLTAYLLSIWRLQTSKGIIEAAKRRSKDLAEYYKGGDIEDTGRALSNELKFRNQETQSDELKNLLPEAVTVLSFLIVNLYLKFDQTETTQLLLTTLMLSSKAQGVMESVVQVRSLEQYEISFSAQSETKKVPLR